jgi:hypothetical protein
MRASATGPPVPPHNPAVAQLTLLQAHCAIMVDACGSNTIQLSMVNASRLTRSVALIISIESPDFLARASITRWPYLL